MRLYPRHWSLALLLVADLFLVPVARADWPPGTTQAHPVSTDSSAYGGRLHVVPDGDGGAYVAWYDMRDVDSHDDGRVWIQHIPANGEPDFRWPEGGQPVSSTHATDDFAMVGGHNWKVFVGWPDARSGWEGDLYAANYVLTYARDPYPWQIPDGLLLSNAPGVQYQIVACPDELGGAYFAWRDGLFYSDIYLQRLDRSGSPTWKFGTVGFPGSRAPNFQLDPAMCPDGRTGCYLAWGTNQEDVYYGQEYDINMTRLESNLGNHWPGSTQRWICDARGWQGHVSLAPDGNTGVFAAWDDQRNGGTQVYAQHISGIGEIVVGWPYNGLSITSTPAPGLLEYFMPVGIPDDSLGCYFVWQERRGALNQDVYAVRVLSDGTRAPGWPANGRVIAPDGAGTGQFEFKAVPDSSGGLMVAWTDGAGAIRITDLDRQGNVKPGWDPGGTLVNVGPGRNPGIAPDGKGGAIVAWLAYRGGAQFFDVYAQKVPQLVTAIRISGLSAAPRSGGGVRVTWQAFLDERTQFQLQRGEALTGPFENLGQVFAADTQEHDFSYLDESVRPGEVYWYRLGYREGTEWHYTAAAVVAVPQAQPSLTLLSTNPSRGAVTLRYSDPKGIAVRLDVFDVSGRLVRSLVRGDVRPGYSTVAWDGKDEFLRPVRSGAYLVNFSSPSGALTKKVVLLR